MLKLARETAAWFWALPDLVLDGGLAVLLLAVEITVKNLQRGAYLGWSSWSMVVTLVVGSLALTVRRRAPRIALVAAALPTVQAVWTGFPVGDIGLSVALYTMADRCPRRQSAVALGLLVAGKIAVGILHPVSAVGIPVWGYFFSVARSFGCHRQTERALRGELEKRAHQLERERELRVRRATADERARIARDLHDIVAHSVSVMVLHTAAARRTLSRDPRRAEEAIAQVETIGRQSLNELRQLLGLLRPEGQESELRPQPSLAYLDDLIEGFREVGLAVDVLVAGADRPLPSVVDLSAYRIIQEALTNALKHAAANLVEVRIRYDPGELRLEINNDGSAKPTGTVLDEGGGHGLVGMRERAALVGGRLTAGHRPGGGFRVDAVLPTES
jgi:signal transduction histidine kinase